MMKRIAQMAMMVVVMMMVVIGAAWADTYAYSYNREATIVEIDKQTDEVVVVDEHGEEWAFYGDGYTVGDDVTLTIFGYGTDTLKDDEIRKVTKRG